MSARSAVLAVDHGTKKTGFASTDALRTAEWPQRKDDNFDGRNEVSRRMRMTGKPLAVERPMNACAHAKPQAGQRNLNGFDSADPYIGHFSRQ